MHRQQVEDNIFTPTKPAAPSCINIAGDNSPVDWMRILGLEIIQQFPNSCMTNMVLCRLVRLFTQIKVQQAPLGVKYRVANSLQKVRIVFLIKFEIDDRQLLYTRQKSCSYFPVEMDCQAAIVQKQIRFFYNDTDVLLWNFEDIWILNDEIY